MIEFFQLNTGAIWREFHERRRAKTRRVLVEIVTRAKAYPDSVDEAVDKNLDAVMKASFPIEDMIPRLLADALLHVATEMRKESDREGS